MNIHKLRIENGDKAGEVCEVPAAGLSVGRSSQNDLSIPDSMLSRRHCRIYPDADRLMVSDLATVNGTFVDGVQIEQDTELRPGSRLKIGDTELIVSATDGSFSEKSPAPSPAPAEVPAQPAPAPSPDSAEVQAQPAPALFPDASAPPPTATKKNLVINVVLACLAVVLLALALKLFLAAPAAAPAAPRQTAAPEPPLAFSYVKLEGSQSNIFRYELELSENGTVSVVIDDAAQGRHARKSSQSPLPAERRAELLRLFENSALGDLPPVSDGHPRRNEWNEIRISALVHGRPITVSVTNDDEPASLRSLREALEDFGRNELGLWAFAVDRETLLAGAAEDFARAERLHDEREVLPGNLYDAVRIFDSCIARLETLDPRPELHDAAVAARAEAAKELETRVAALNWRAEHAANMKDWAEAAAALRDLTEVVPDRSDPRNEAARRRLLDAESRIGRKK